MRNFTRVAGISALCSTLLLAACAGVPASERPQPELPQRLGYGDGAQGSTVPLHWWTDFADPALDQLVAQGLANNFSLQAAWASLAQSRALWRQAGAGQYPDLNLSLERSRSWTETTTSDSWSAGLTTEYEVDFWGRVSALDDQARLSVLASEAALRTQANTVAAQVAISWYGLRMEQENLALLQAQQQRLQESLQVVRGRFRRGQTEMSDVWQQQQLLESIAAEIITAEATRAAYQQQLALWTGNSDWFSLSQAELPQQQDGLPVPAAVIGAVGLAPLSRRPDVEQAWYQVRRADAALAAAVANRYPRFTLSASYSGSDAELANVLDNWLANLAGGLVLPLIDGGNRRAVVAENEAAVQQALANYQQTLLEAADDVQQALIDERQSADSLQSLQNQLALARKTEAFIHSRYRKGVGDFLSLLDAQRSTLSLEQQVLTARWNRVQSRIQLYRAVSHGDFSATDNDKEPQA